MNSYQNAGTLRRINMLTRILTSKVSIRPNFVRAINLDGKVTIDNVEKDIKLPKNLENVPQKYITLDPNGNLKLSQTVLHHLRWMLQKDNLGQDIFLIGRPGPLRRSIAMQYLELTQREFEYVALSRDTTESDLKQRREIQQGTAVYFDQCAVRAATEGRVLVIESIEKAERNVLPVLNNLLENREMHLEDGRFLIPSSRYDKLLAQHGQTELDRWGLLRVSEDFRVIALGLPVPKYRGAALDPPLRSRFQARNIENLSYQENFTELSEVASNADGQSLTQILSFGIAILASDAKSNLPEFPLENLKKIATILQNNKNIPIYDAIYRLYPYNCLLPKTSHDTILGLMSSLNITLDKNVNSKILSIEDSKENTKLVKIEVGKRIIKFPIPNGKPLNSEPLTKFYPNEYQTNLLADIIQSYAAGDFCIIGAKGSGKSATVFELSRLLNQSFETVVLYQDMTARDLIQNRTTNLSGDTIWRDSPLIQAALNGSIVILDGIHRIHHSTLSILHRLVHDREIELFDERRLIREDKYNALLESGLTVEELNKKKIIKIQPAFRIIALAEPPTLEATTNWLTPEMLSLFMFHEIRNLDRSEENAIVNKLYGKPDKALEKIINLSHFLRASRDSVQQNLSSTLSTRQIIRIANRISHYDSDCYDLVQRVFLSKFLPILPRQALETALERFEIIPSKSNKKTVKIEVGNGKLKIGDTSAEIYKTTSLSKVPEILFYDVPQHIQLLEYLLQDFILGNHLLLVGNQGVGKNKIADRFLQLMNRPREYIQLHRDTTVQTLTLQPSVRDGVVVYEDSPLVKAVKYGHILVIDEADKAPIHVTCILKTLVENGEMTLSDGRKILPKTNKNIINDENFITTHSDFRMIVLANRPGFPFLGNDFFAALGDHFSCHAVDNPSIESELFLLQQYGPNVPLEIIKKLVNAFDELRTLADIGKLSYPYSTREVVNIIKHLENYPDENIVELIGNVLDFDRYTPESLEMVTSILQKHGLPIEAYAKNELAAIRRQKEIQVTVTRKSGLSTSQPKHGKIDPKNEPHVGGNTWAGGSGGRDTAGLGGKGGPYRLDAGHKVHQLSDAEKDDIPEHVKKAAREMNRKAFADKLKEIQMSEYDHKIYEQFSLPVRKQVQELRVVLSSLQAKSKERHWQKHQTSGELDDMKLIEGITGERNIYRRRADQEPEPGQPQEKPKKIKLVVDVSGSMYRFNGYDGRLDRELEAVVLVMEAFQGFESRVLYDIIGHSGETCHIPFVEANNPPKDNKLRLQTIKMMHSHAQFCWSGDHTLEAAEHAVDAIAKEDCDEAIVIILSDANLERYAISTKKLSDAITKQEPKVQAYTIFIGSLGEEALEIKNNMPAGKSFICMDLAELPSILKQIFSSSVLKNIN